MSLEGPWNWRFGGWQAARRWSGSIIEWMVIDMNEVQVRLDRIQPRQDRDDATKRLNELQTC